MRAAVGLMDGGAGTCTLCLTGALSSCEQQEWEFMWELEACCQARPGAGWAWKLLFWARGPRLCCFQPALGWAKICLINDNNQEETEIVFSTFIKGIMFNMNLKVLFERIPIRSNSDPLDCRSGRPSSWRVSVWRVGNENQLYYKWDLFKLKILSPSSLVIPVCTSRGDSSIV